jgi:tetratricopeptide (TPR) repeat protein
MSALLEFERLIPDSVEVAMRAEDPGQFVRWVRDALPSYATFGSPVGEDVSLTRALAFAWARAVWNGLPLNAAAKKPPRMQDPVRGEKCPCGSGRRFEECCLQVPTIPPLAQDVLWPYVLAHIPATARSALLSGNRVPRSALIEFAAYMLDLDRRGEVITALEPKLTSPERHYDEECAILLDLLCDAYGMSGKGARRKLKLLQATTERAPRSPLRSEAWQRLATIYMDQGESDRAWRAFRQGQQDNPHADALPVLEVELLVAEHRLDEARGRATFWSAALRRSGVPSDDPRIQFLQRVASDPVAALGEIAIEVQGAGRHLHEWLGEVSSRAVPEYGLRELDGSSLLVAPPLLSALEHEWHAVFTLEKPFSVQDQPFGAEDVWDEIAETRWCDFLRAHPESFDSLDILDDLATAIGRHPQSDAPGLSDLLLAPVLARTEAIMKLACSRVTSPSSPVKLPWEMLQNRPGLRSLVRLFQQHLAHNDREHALATAEWVLALNPGDNHGLRFMLVNEYLREGSDAKALALAERYPDDVAPETRFGAVLALLRLSRHLDAECALLIASVDLPKTLHYLLPARIRRPKLKRGSVQVGGDDQAWLYRDEMRSVWQQTPGALEWLKEHS